MTLITLITSDNIVLSDGVNPHFRTRKMRACALFFVDLKFPYRTLKIIFFYAFWLYWETGNLPFILDGFLEHITDLKNKVED